MHVIEHIGLERYGDPLDAKGDLKAITELKRVLSQDGNLLFVVPLGERAVIQYNAHRIYTYKQILSYFSELKLISFSYINDDGIFIPQAGEKDTADQVYGCGCFQFQK
jgi:hypothetical protein